MQILSEMGSKFVRITKSTRYKCNSVHIYYMFRSADNGGFEPQAASAIASAA